LEARIHQSVQRVESQSGQPFGLTVQPGQSGKVGQRRTPPQVECRAQSSDASSRVGYVSRLREQPGEDLQVGAILGEPEQVSERPGHDASRSVNKARRADTWRWRVFSAVAGGRPFQITSM